MSNAPIVGSAAMVAVLQQQLADVVASKTAALVRQAAVLADGDQGIDYSINEEAGGESYNFTNFLRILQDMVRDYTQLEQDIMSQLQSLQPFRINVRHRV